VQTIEQDNTGNYLRSDPASLIMARRINIGDIGNFCEGQMNQLMRVVVFETDAELKRQSPVDTGRFRSLAGPLAKMQLATIRCTGKT
jgi:hypothetical protein